jgi:spore maturation protein CgeB
MYSRSTKYSSKILIVSNQKEDGYADFIVDAFCRNFDSDVLYTKSNNEKLYFFDRILNKLNIELDKSDLNMKIIRAIFEKKYKIIIIVKGNRIYPWTLRKIKEAIPHIKLISWSADNMSKWHNKSFMYHYGVNYYDAVFCTNIPDYRNIENFCYKPVFYFDKRAEFDFHTPVLTKDKSYEDSVVFIGSYEKERAQDLNFLANNGIKIDIFGNGWDRAKRYCHNNLNITIGELKGKDYVTVISSAKITLGFLRRINKDTQTSRTFEIPACGGFMLMEKSQDHLRLFIDGEEAVFFDNKRDLLRKLRYYLGHDLERISISKKGREKVESGRFFFDDLTYEMVELIDQVES